MLDVPQKAKKAIMDLNKISKCKSSPANKSGANINKFFIHCFGLNNSNNFITFIVSIDLI